ncbi:rCG37489 [Rattus norvegicus]|uniref:RCG37489 n=1 Tax=Rattus norvegicus TaxID=10116 RepID=A6KIB4_RAT|nr:rCG37489 [Rattus norvegicus]
MLRWRACHTHLRTEVPQMPRTHANKVRCCVSVTPALHSQLGGGDRRLMPQLARRSQQVTREPVSNEGKYIKVIIKTLEMEIHLYNK